MAGLYLIGFAAPAFEAAACHVGETIDPDAQRAAGHVRQRRRWPRSTSSSCPSSGSACSGRRRWPATWRTTLGPTFAPLLGGAAKAAAIWFMVFNMFHGTLQPLAGAARTLSQLAEDGLLPRVLAPALAHRRALGRDAADRRHGHRLPAGGRPDLGDRRRQPDLPDRHRPAQRRGLAAAPRRARACARPYRAPRGTIGAGPGRRRRSGALATVLGFEQFGLPTVLAGLAPGLLGLAALRLAALERPARAPGCAALWRSLHLKLTGAMLLVLALDGAGYLLAVSNVEHAASRR